MAVRSTMANLISRVRDLIGDTATVLSSQQIQDALDRNVMRVRTAPMEYEVTQANGSTDSYLDYFAPCRVGEWEEDVTIQDSSYTTLTPSTSDYLTGHWVLSASTAPPVYLTGKHYNVYAAAAQCLRQWAALVKLHFDVSEQGVSMSRNQKYNALIALAREYEGKAPPRTITSKRGDIAGGDALHEYWRFRVSARTPR